MESKMDLAKLTKRRQEIMKTLSDEAPYAMIDQKHLDANTPERAYWHLGYAAALKDIERMVEHLPQ